MSKPRRRSGAHPRVAPALAAVLSAALLSGLAVSPAWGQVDRALEAQTAAEREAQRSQSRIDALDDETRELLQRYRAAITEAETLDAYNAQVERLVSSQQEEIDSKRSQLERIADTNQNLYPHLNELLDTLQRFVALDLPFLPEERQMRLDELRAMMDRADVSVAEKYRRIMEAYAVELEYGRTLEAWQGELPAPADGAPRSVSFLRVGRLALLYQTLDGSESGYWDPQRDAFVADNDWRDSVRQGLRVARRQAAPDLLRVPVPAPTRPEAEDAR